MIHQDSGNLPGPVVATRSLAAGRSLLFSGMVLSQPRAVYAYVASFPATHLEPGVYWVELFETDGRSDLCFIWQTGALDATRGRDGNAYSDSAPGATWSAILRADDNLDNRQITLVSQPAVVDVPTLGGWGLVALGGSLFAVGLRRARVRR